MYILHLSLHLYPNIKFHPLSYYLKCHTDAIYKNDADTHTHLENCNCLKYIID